MIIGVIVALFHPVALLKVIISALILVYNVKDSSETLFTNTESSVGCLHAFQ